MLQTNRILWTVSLAMISLLVLLSAQGIAQRHERSGYQCIFSGLVPDASARVTFRPIENGRGLQYTLKVKNIENITMAHLHLGTVGEFGTPVAWLYPSSPPPELKSGTFTGVLAEGTIKAKDLMGPMRNEPMSMLIKHMERGHTYANIHTEEYPEGEICGPVRLIQSEERTSETNSE